MTSMVEYFVSGAVVLVHQHWSNAAIQANRDERHVWQGETLVLQVPIEWLQGEERKRGKIILARIKSPT